MYRSIFKNILVVIATITIAACGGGGGGGGGQGIPNGVGGAQGGGVVETYVEKGVFSDSNTTYNNANSPTGITNGIYRVMGSIASVDSISAANGSRTAGTYTNVSQILIKTILPNLLKRILQDLVKVFLRSVTLIFGQIRNI